MVTMKTSFAAAHRRQTVSEWQQEKPRRSGAVRVGSGLGPRSGAGRETVAVRWGASAPANKQDIVILRQVARNTSGYREQQEKAPPLRAGPIEFP